MRSGRGERERSRTVEHERRVEREESGSEAIEWEQQWYRVPRGSEDSTAAIRFPSVCRYTIKTNARSQELTVSAEAAKKGKLGRERDTQMTIFLWGQVR